MPSVERFAYVVPTIADLESHIQRALAPHVTAQDVSRGDAAIRQSDLLYRFANLVPNKMMLPDEEAPGLVY
jgi:hypothetical protein